VSTDAAADGSPVPFVDLKRAEDRIRDELREAFERVSGSTAYTLGPEVEVFELEFAAYCGTAHAVGISDGTEALRLALLAMGAGPGREVVAPAMTHIATIEAIAATGATPVLVDVDENHAMDVRALSEVVDADSAAIVPVHLYGRPADMEGIWAVGDKAAVPVLEDASQAHGALLGDQRAGSFGTAAAFSFHPSANLGALGDGGAVTTSDDEIAEAVRSLRSHGSVRGDANRSVRRGGATGRLDALQAAFLRVKLPHLDAWIAERRAAADLYRDVLAELPVELPPADPPTGTQVFNLFVILVEGDRDAVLERLHARGIAAAVHYPTACHLQPGFEWLGYAPGDFPNAERIAANAISLPIFPGITDEEIERVGAALR
jgi:dTDP-4-amino-4,6-dideoxygalactose transaminase